jgi:hypothetical protein
MKSCASAIDRTRDDAGQTRSDGLAARMSAAISGSGVELFRISLRSSGLRTNPDSRQALGVLRAECGLVAGVATGDADMNLVTLADRE